MDAGECPCEEDGAKNEDDGHSEMRVLGAAENYLLDGRRFAQTRRYSCRVCVLVNRERPEGAVG